MLDIIELDEEQKKNVFIQGQAGTGKSTLIKYIQRTSEENVVLSSPTALAATTIGGCTLHSLFRLAPKDYFDPVETILERNKGNDVVLRHIQILVVDEISMVRPDMLDCIDLILKDVKHSNKPFGGIQVILVGDLYQLPPIIKSDIKEVFEDKYGFGLPYFFDSKAYKEGKFKNFELNIVHRQEDLELLENLQNPRNKSNMDTTLKFFKSIPRPTSEFGDATVITPYKIKAEEINKTKLDKLETPEKCYSAIVTGNFKNIKETPAPEELILKEGAFVLFTKNDKEKQWVNGSTGIVVACGYDFVTVLLTNSGRCVTINRETWQLIKYNYDKKTKKITEEVMGEFKQFPLILGYATTMHKVQSKTLDEVIIDTDRGVFAPGQLYVALSRTRRKEDMAIKSYIKEKDVIVDPRIKEFLKGSVE